MTTKQAFEQVLEFVRDVAVDSDAHCGGWATRARVALDAWEGRSRLANNLDVRQVMYDELVNVWFPGSATKSDLVTSLLDVMERHLFGSLPQASADGKGRPTP